MIIFENIFILLILLLWLSYSLICLILKTDKVKWLTIIPVSIHLLWIIYRIIITGHAPFSNVYESLVFFSFLYLLKTFIFAKNFNNIIKFIILIPGELLLFISLLLPEQFKTPNLLVPALQSFWIYIHVPALFICYSSLTLAFIIGLTGIILKKNFEDIITEEVKQCFFFLSIGIITGAFWAENSWSVFWNWDAKEIWALITWLFVGIVFHIESKRLKIIFIFFAFLSMIFTYFGVMFLLPSLHSYAR